VAARGSITIDTPRLRLEPLRADDAAELFAYRSDPVVARYQGWKPATVGEVARFIAEQAARVFGNAGWYQLAIRARGDGALIGDLGIRFPDDTSEAIEFGVTLKPAAQGQGHAREALAAVVDRAFGAWGYRRLACSVDPRNLASVALCRALGFRQEAHHVESLWFRGEWVDDLVFALLAREWATRRGQRAMP